MLSHQADLYNGDKYISFFIYQKIYLSFNCPKAWIPHDQMSNDWGKFIKWTKLVMYNRRSWKRRPAPASPTSHHSTVSGNETKTVR